MTTEDRARVLMAVRTGGAAFQVDEDFYEEFLGCVPPLRMGGSRMGHAFLISEPYSHNSDGRGIYLGCYATGEGETERFWAFHATAAQYDDGVPTTWPRFADPDYTQLCCWEGCVVGEDDVEKFEAWFVEKFGCRAKYATEVVTGPGQGGPGGRNDLLFYVHKDDVGKFAVQRFAYGIRWWEDVISDVNGGRVLYDAKTLDEYRAAW